MLTIKPHIWFGQDKAKDAAEFYTTLLPNSSLSYVNHFPMSDIECEVVEFALAGQPFFGISGVPGARISPSISFMINFDPSRDPDAAKRIDEVWNKLSENGQVMMPLDSYPFSERYGWISDKYGVSWQLILTNPAGEERPVIVPSLLYTGQVAGKANEAIDFYCSVFKDSKRGTTAPRPEDMGPDKADTLMFADFYIDQTWFAAMDSAHSHGFGFNEAVSLLIPCETQEEIDYYWSALSADGEPGQCGWLKDKYGVSWQVASTVMFEALKNGSAEQIARITQAFMTMKKVDVAALQEAYAPNR
ncbi:Glyoxalase superfamily enzyme, possibly 3-demethylubiquinone-9 3-methyltransferase [Mucilaginibacter gossypiicola]|uniref:Glyoxalase superfamily enzyme, possibly 3-demethylubiquinone-9 3-methyltransferase n=1 Tax=Mucilaginibacter gossypiicola TaxID=551995 RepID=A0A1H8MB22_9SPHI|nr:VOC family protein [Mucilaginibacter gossypiicola]SEO14577.1 Glyoxalase superfamily enzyme, possibly 3-demethylubiquinone-9 3-methyltransferase [Mucilaginibacter gossypiicola]